MIEEDSYIPIITGLRRKEELDYFKDYFGNDDFKLVFVYADEEIRSTRLCNRGAPRDPHNDDGFKKQMDAEAKRFHLDYLRENCDVEIECNMTLEELKSDFENYVAQNLPFLDEWINQSASK